MSQRLDPFNVRWGDVRAKVKAELDEVKDALVRAAPGEIAGLQGRAIALQSLIGWFERGAIAEAEITRESTPRATSQAGY